MAQSQREREDKVSSIGVGAPWPQLVATGGSCCTCAVFPPLFLPLKRDSQRGDQTIHAYLIASTVPMDGVVRLCISFHVSSIALDILCPPR